MALKQENKTKNLPSIIESIIYWIKFRRENKICVVIELSIFSVESGYDDEQ